MFSHIGFGEIVVLLLIVLLLFGPRRLPELAQSIGKSMKLFKQGLRDADEEPRSKDSDQKPS
jgi:sec-independent protein translocase protein TatA